MPGGATEGPQKQAKQKGGLRAKWGRFSSRSKTKDVGNHGSQITPSTGTGSQTQSIALNLTSESALDSKTSTTACGLDQQTLGPIRELWNEAYEELKLKEEKLIEDYEATLVGNVSAAVLGSTVGKKDRIKAIVTAKMAEVKENTWRLNFGRNEIAVKDLAEPIVGIMKWADKNVGDALSASPPATIAWAGVVLLMPVSIYQLLRSKISTKYEFQLTLSKF